MNQVIATVPGGRKKSVKQALKTYKKKEDPKCFSHFYTEIRGADGKLKWSYSRPGPEIHGYRHNLTTDTASGYTNRRDWQSKALGGGLAPVASMTGTATASSGTTLTNSGASFPTASQGLAGMIVVVGPNASGTGAISFGVIVSNTGTVLTVDQWYSGGTWATGTTPNATGLYTILPGQFPAMYLAITTDATTPTSADTTLTSELTSGGLARALATWAHTAAAGTYTLTHQWTSSTTATINKEAVFGAVNTTAGGVMPFESAEPTPPALISGDTLTNTVTITI